MENRKNAQIEIDLGAIMHLLFTKLPVIIITSAIFLFANVLYVNAKYAPYYTSSTKLYVMPKSSTGSLNSDLQAGATLTKDYVELIQSREVTEAVSARLTMKNTVGGYISPGAIRSMIRVSVADNTRVITIFITDADPFRACDIANCVREEAAKHITTVMNAEAVNVVDEASIPMAKSGPNPRRNGILGGIFGAFLAIAAVIIFNLADDTIKNAGDIQKYLEISALGVIPLAEGVKRNKRHRFLHIGRRR
uniref:YveK family protein n=1 Tax=Eubacterium cellulosolvens TaxID=29322 RepID=UPI000484CFBC|nr:Wzz/FepE/Etk N-terminal domain-containing protein [[Eubacterium] cellulosolvens]